MFKTPMQKLKIKQQLDTSKIINPTAYSNLWDTMKMFKNRNLQLQVPTFKKNNNQGALKEIHDSASWACGRTEQVKAKLLRSGRN